MAYVALPPIPVASEFGWTSIIPNPVTCRWLEYLRKLNPTYTIDIGAGFGVATIPALQIGGRVIANDISQEQLKHIAQLAQEKGLRNKLELLCAALPRLPGLRDLDAIHASNVLHFLTGDEMIEAANWMAAALKPKGKVFIQTISPYAGHFQRFVPQYEQKKRERFKWPGEMHAARDFVDVSVRDMTPSFMHVLEIDSARRLFQDAGFQIEYCDYYSRPGLPLVCRLDGRENLGLVAVKY
jgi:SAM-dependent methyltransferase